MNKEFIPCKQALELKELGFDEECLGWYPKDTVALSLHGVFIGKPSLGSYKLLAYAPLYQQAFRWFRENYGLHQHIEYVNITDRYEGWVSGIMFDCKTYEEAELACLKKLIQIIKGK
jgi:hypothetical protein